MLEVAGGVRAVERGPLRYRAVLRLILRCGGPGSNATPAQLGAIPARSSDLTDLDGHSAGFLAALLGRDSARAPLDGRLASVTGTPEEQHTLGMRMVADFLEADGWEVLMLGAGAPVEDLLAMVNHEQPDLIALSTATAG